ncbi:uncharacterized protein ARMOST_16814 [Armillaria ostoyae]|uniref:F-box domain-containing protein n=1 Tax=Armillaria ostoyae TaxID=47428 RepID=A0A284RXB1_ARMOS|nr:uncharacterized protein ARMOST_16814 [Armillaria ostoyae]
MGVPRRPRRSVVRRRYDESGSEPEDDPSPNYKAPSASKSRKKQRVGEPGSEPKAEIQVSRKRPRRRKGFLEKVMESPLELVFEIFSYLYPIDLIRLSRTTKDLRALLLQRSSEFVWKNTRENVKGLPPLPSYMSEPYYANLVFDTHCQCCSQSTTLVQWEAGVRYCKRCLEYSGTFTTQCPDLWSPLLQLVPLFEQKVSVGRYSDRIRSWLHVPSIRLLEEESHKGFGDSWLIRKNEELSSRRANARALEQWAKERAADRSSELEAVRCERFKEVTDRLTALGWGEEIAKLEDVSVLKYHKLVWQAKPLTERIWTNISEILVGHMRSQKAMRIENEERTAIDRRCKLFLSMYQEFASSLPEIPVIPRQADVLLSEPFSVVILNTPLLDAVTEEILKEPFVHFKEIAARWREEKNCELQGVMKKSGFESKLNLATTLFHCESCASRLAYPDVLRHFCCTQLRYISDLDLKKNRYKALWNMPCHTWYADKLRFDQVGFDKATAVVKLCGLDPETATAQDMDDMNPRLTCLQCSSTNRRCIISWRAATARHNPADTWALLTEESDIQQAQELERQAKLHEFQKMYPSEDVKCNHCHIIKARSKLLPHLLSEHNISEVSLEDWTWPLVNTFKLRLYETVMLPKVEPEEEMPPESGSAPVDNRSSESAVVTKSEGEDMSTIQEE